MCNTGVLADGKRSCCCSFNLSQLLQLVSFILTIRSNVTTFTIYFSCIAEDLLWNHHLRRIKLVRVCLIKQGRFLSFKDCVAVLSAVDTYRSHALILSVSMFLRLRLLPVQLLRPQHHGVIQPEWQRQHLRWLDHTEKDQVSLSLALFPSFCLIHPTVLPSVTNTRPPSFLFTPPPLNLSFPSCLCLDDPPVFNPSLRSWSLGFVSVQINTM